MKFKKIFYLLFCLTLLFSCEESIWTFPQWKDTDITLKAITCAIEKMYGKDVTNSVMKIEIRVRPDYMFNGRYDYKSETILLNANAKSAFSSALRHEIFEHRLPHILEDNVNWEHSLKWKEIGKKLSELTTECKVNLQAQQ